MKTRFNKSVRRIWRLLTEVPGWPDAPRGVRIRRASPIVIPCVALVLLTGWKLAVLDPRMRAEQAFYQPVQALQEEVSALRMGYSDQQAIDVGEEFASVRKLTLAENGEVPGVLDTIRNQAAARGWSAVLHASESTDEAPAPDSSLAFKQVRARLAPTPGQTAPFASLLAFLDQLLTGPKRIDLTRIAIRADEQGRHAVELNLRLVRLVPHEKAAE